MHLVYVMTSDPAINIERVRQRVLKGGHDVPQGKIVERYWRSLEQLPWFLEAADIGEVFDNSDTQPRRVAYKQEGGLTLSADAPANLLKALGAA